MLDAVMDDDVKSSDEVEKEERPGKKILLMLDVF